MINSDIININAKINVLKEEYTKQENEVNYFYWPKDALIRKRKKDYIWLFSISICVLIIAILSVLFEILKNEYLIGMVLGLSVLLLGFTGFMVLRYQKKYSILKAEWNKSLEPINKLKIELDEKMDLASKMMIDFLTSNFNKNEESILKEAGSSYEEIYVYYDHLINS